MKDFGKISDRLYPSIRHRYRRILRNFVYFWRVICRVGPSQIGLLSAGVAFYALLAIFPAIAAIVALAGLFTEPDAVVSQLEVVARLMPIQAATILLDQASKVAGATDEGLSITLIVGFAFAVYLATRATTGMIHGLNVVHRRVDTRSMFRYWWTVVWLTVTMLIGTVLLFVLLVVTPAILAFMPQEVMSLETAGLIRGVRWILVALIFATGLGLLYRYGPAGGQPRWISPGILIASGLWFLGSFAFALYVSNFGYYNEAFGSLGGVIILLTWLWLSAFFVLFGALVDAEFGIYESHNQSRPVP